MDAAIARRQAAEEDRLFKLSGLTREQWDANEAADKAAAAGELTRGAQESQDAMQAAIAGRIPIGNFDAQTASRIRAAQNQLDGGEWYRSLSPEARAEEDRKRAIFRQDQDRQNMGLAPSQAAPWEDRINGGVLPQYADANGRLLPQYQTQPIAGATSQAPRAVVAEKPRIFGGGAGSLGGSATFKQLAAAKSEAANWRTNGVAPGSGTGAMTTPGVSTASGTLPPQAAPVFGLKKKKDNAYFGLPQYNR